MSEQWFQQYVQLSFRMDKVMRKFTDSRFVDYYYGPPAWKMTVEAEQETPTARLVRAAIALADSLPDQNFESGRTAYLAKQILALETVCRKLNGETFALEEEVQRCFDILPSRVPELQFEEALALYDEALPGDGNIADRFLAWKRRYELPREKSDLLIGFMQRAMAEARRRARTFLELPPGEGVEVDTVSDKVFFGENWYLGNYRSRVEVNTDLPANLAVLLDLMCHESYPGHHVEFVMKEQHLYRECGYTEQAIAPIISPQAVISEGIAMMAYEMVFTPGEAEQWLAEHIYPQAGIAPVTVDWGKLRRADDMLEGVAGNAAFMLHEGRADTEVAQYLKKYQLLTDENASKMLEFLKDPSREAYIFTYFYGKQLMQPWLKGEDRRDVFRRFLTRQLNPSDLLKK